MKEDSVTRAYYQGIADYEAALFETNVDPGSEPDPLPSYEDPTNLSSHYTTQLNSDWETVISEFHQSLQSIERAVHEFHTIYDSTQTLEESELDNQLQGYKEYLQNLSETNSQLIKTIKEFLDTESN